MRGHSPSRRAALAAWLGIGEQALAGVDDSAIAVMWERMQDAHTDQLQEELTCHLTESIYRLRAEVEHDPLTGTLNRRGLEDRLRAAAHVLVEGGPVALMLVDVNGLKETNDRYGHAAGDSLLEAVACRLRERLRQGDSIARIGGDEFVIVCPGVDEAAAARLADTLTAVACQGPVEVGGLTIPVIVSIGWATAGNVGEARDLIGRADAAMYRVKRRGEAPEPFGC